MEAESLKSKPGFQRLIKATIYSFKGFRSAYKHEVAFRQELFLVICLLPIALWLDVSVIERIALVGSLGLVLIVELLNSAVEAVVDRVGTELHKLSGRAKDLGSAAVFVSLMLAFYTWSSILWSHFS